MAHGKPPPLKNGSRVLLRGLAHFQAERRFDREGYGKELVILAWDEAGTITPAMANVIDGYSRRRRRGRKSR